MANLLSFRAGGRFWRQFRKITGWVLFIGGILLASFSYYVLFATARPAELMVPPSYNPAPGKNDFKITVFSDWMQASGAIEKIASDLRDRGADFAFCLGDFVHPAQPSVMKLAVKKLKTHFTVPVYATPGNHDVYNAEDAAGFGAVFGNVNNCFAYGDTFFILLESAKTSVDSEQLKWLKFILENERPKYRRCVIVTHVPPVTVPEMNKRKYRLSEENAAELQKITDAGNVDLIICGHAHYEMDLPFGKSRVLVVPPSGQGSRNRSNPQFGSLQLHFKADGSIGREFVYYGKDAKVDRWQYFIYRRLNQRAVFFSIALGMIIAGGVLLIFSSRCSSGNE